MRERVRESEREKERKQTSNMHIYMKKIYIYIYIYTYIFKHTPYDISIQPYYSMILVLMVTKNESTYSVCISHHKHEKCIAGTNL